MSGLSRDELIVDLFAGGGGASQGIYQATGRHPDLAVNHDGVAISVHAANHPGTRHECASIWQVEPRAATQGRPVGLLWASPDCRHFSRAAGGRPKWKSVRSLPGVVITWATRVKPRMIVVENVREMLGWGPLLDDGTPCPERIGRSFNWWVGRLRGLGYRVQWRELCAADFGAPTIRTRLVIVARCDDAPIVWPVPTHSREPGLWGSVWRPAADCIDWSIPCQSIFGRAKPLADATLRRVAEGVRRYVLDRGMPFIAGCGGRTAQSPPRPISVPMGTITTKADQVLVAAFLAQHNLGNVGRPLRAPISTLTTTGSQQQLVQAHLSAEHQAGADRVAAFLAIYYGSGGQTQDLRTPLGAVTTRDRFALVTVDGIRQPIVDIGMRMLAPHELAAAQGFPADYVLNRLADGRPVNKKDQVRLIGNSVCPPMAEAVIRSNLVPGQTARRAA